MHVLVSTFNNDMNVPLKFETILLGTINNVVASAFLSIELDVHVKSTQSPKLFKGEIIYIKFSRGLVCQFVKQIISKTFYNSFHMNFFSSICLIDWQ